MIVKNEKLKFDCECGNLENCDTCNNEKVIKRQEMNKASFEFCKKIHLRGDRIEFAENDGILKINGKKF